MSNELKLEKLEDVLTIDQTTLKAQEAKDVIKKIKQLMKVDKIEDVEAQEEASDYPYTGVSVVGDKLITLKFDLQTNKARVVSAEKDTRDTRGRNHMVTYFAINTLEKLAKEQK